jgi:hypothetical protein
VREGKRPLVLPKRKLAPHPLVGPAINPAINPVMEPRQLLDQVVAQVGISGNAPSTRRALWRIDGAPVPINDALPGQPPTAFQMIREIITKVSPPSRGGQPDPEGCPGRQEKVS